MEEFTPDIITVTDGDGIEHRFEILNRLDEANGVGCLAITPVYENKEEILSDDGDFDIVRLHEEDGGFVLEPVDDPDEFNKLHRQFERRIEKILFGD